MAESVPTTSNSANEKIALQRRALEKLIRELFTARDKNWQVDLKPEYGLPKTLVMVVDKLLAGVREQLRAREAQMSSLQQANMRMLFLNESMMRLNVINESVERPIEDNRAHYCEALNDIMSATAARLAVLFFVDGRGLITELYNTDFDNSAVPETGDYIDFLGSVSRAFLDNQDKPLIIHSASELIGQIRWPSGHPQIRNMLALPLTFKGQKQVRGVMYVANKRQNLEFDVNDLTMAELFLNEISNVRERKRLTRQLQREKEEQARLLEEIRRAQEQLLQSEKMASVGQLAAGVAHEINNPVGYINSNIGSLQTYLRDVFDVIEQYQTFEQFLPEEKRLEMAKIRDAADLEFLRQDVGDLVKESIEGIARVKQIVTDLKNFSRIDESEWGYADLHQCIDSTLNIVQNEVKYKADVIKEYGDIPKVWCIASQINQVILNLLVNAVHAIKDRGTIIITTRQTENSQVQVSVADTGKGIPENIISRIFDPFFTSKPVGEGTGLGLSLSYSIIEKHHGRIEVASKVGEGSVFTITLPVNRQTETRETAT
ncbi:MAG: hypothetical protein QG652_1622 [Pseudomonadota bacterium]|nr:hypothetical protein [Pseudomonadota bacterium]